MSTPNFYDILGVPQNANVDEIKKYMNRLGISNYTPSDSVKTLDEIKTTEVTKPVAKKPVKEELEVTEVEVQDPV